MNIWSWMGLLLGLETQAQQAEAAIKAGQPTSFSFNTYLFGKHVSVSINVNPA